MMENFYKKWKLSFFILIAITIIMSYAASQIEIGESKESRYNIYSVTFEYYGMDSKQIEELITIPLEEKIMILEGLLELRSSIEFGKSVTTAYFSKKINYKRAYLNIRDSVDKLYETLPKDVQRPRIQSSSTEDKAFLCVSFTGNSMNGNMRSWLENNLKKEIEAIDCVAEAIISGGDINEIEIAFDSDKVVALGQNPSMLSTIVRDGNSINAGTKLSYKNFIENIIFDTKLHTLDEVRSLPIKTNESYTTLGYFADVSKRPRVDNEIVRINGKECVSLGVKATSNGNIISISKKCRKIIDNKNFKEGTYQYLYDNGKTLEKLIQKTILAAISSFICIILIIPIFFNSIKTLIISTIFLFINTIWVIGLLQLLGYTLDQNTLSGITIALGLIADSMFVLAETSESSLNFDTFIHSFAKLIPSIISASMTTLLVLVPLYFLEEIVPGIKNISITISLMIIVSVFLSVTFFPCFIYEKKHGKKCILKETYVTNFNNSLKKKIIYCSLLSIKNYRFLHFTYFGLMIVPLIIFIWIGKDLSFPNNSEVIFCSVEFEPESSASYINESINDLINKIHDNTAVNFVRTEVKKGTAQLEVGFNEKNIQKKDLINYIQSLDKYVSDGFLYVPGIKKSNFKNHSIEVAVVGDDIKQCRKYAKQASEILNKSGICDSVVLNFKRPEYVYEFTPSEEMMVRNSITTQQLASSIRWMIFGPVADKWIENGEEFDIRIRGKNLQLANRSDLENLHLPVKDSAIRITSIGTINKTEGQGRIYRKDQKRCAYLTIESSNGSIDKIIKDVRFYLSQIDIKTGYGFSFSQDVEKISYKYRVIFITLIISLVGIIILLTALTEKIEESLVISSIIPVSFVFPLIIKLILIKPLQLGDITGMVLLSGIGVNNTIYMIMSNNFKPVFKFRNKYKSIMITSLTSIVSAIPLLFIKEESFSKNLSFFMFLGILGTLFTCLLIYPGFLESLNNKRTCIQNQGSGLYSDSRK